MDAIKHKDTKAQRHKGALCLCVFVFNAVTLMPGSSSDFDFPGTVAERLHLDADFVEHAEEQIGHRGFVRRDVTSSLDSAVSAAHENHGQRCVIMSVSVTHRAAVENHGMIQQVTVAI